MESEEKDTKEPGRPCRERYPGEMFTINWGTAAQSPSAEMDKLITRY